MKCYLLFLCGLLFLGCKQQPSQRATIQEGIAVSVQYAQGFTISQHEDYQVLEVTEAFPGAEVTFKYGLVKSPLSRKRTQELNQLGITTIIQIPVQSIVVTSTTHIPSLEMLGVENTLTGFPNLDYISSKKTRSRISKGAIKELGQNESLNTEVAIDLSPDVVIGFGVDGQNKSLNSLEKAGIPVLYNGDWVEKSPLGKAEWVKFFGALYDKQEEAASLFSDIKTAYITTKELASQVTSKPTVLSGAMYKDVWYLPHGESWPAQLIADAGGDYLWSDTEGTGSIAMSIESVLDKAQNADFWIAPAQYTSYRKLKSDNPVYSKFDAFINKKTYTFATKKGATGGLLYYELAPNRPDLVLKDMVYYLHPQLLPDYKPFFFTALGD